MIVVLGGPHIRPDNLNLLSVVRDLYRFYRLTRPGELLRASHFIMTLWIMI